MIASKPSLTLIFWLLLSSLSFSQIQPRTKLVVLNIDTKDLLIDAVTMGNLVRLESQQTNLYEVIDMYDLVDQLGEEAIIGCYSKRCLTESAQAVKASKVIAGHAERIGEKIMITLKLIDVASQEVERTHIGEYINEESEIQKMVELTVNDLLGLENEEILVNNLAYFTSLDQLPTTRIINNGPRMGVAYLIGDMAERFEAPKSQGGYDAYPILSQFGYQHELQYLSSGNFQALGEILVMVSGLEQSLFIPSLVVMNGFRESKLGFEFAFGPSFSIRKMADGYYADGVWHLEHEWRQEDSNGQPIPNPNEISTQLDRRGDPEFFSRWVWSVGKTFRSGYLNIPVNVYASPRKDDWMVGLSVGFNVRKGRK
ncbi:MAG: hypothetical protein AAF587_11485 [Bacteroidota bacterium]